MKFYKRIFLFFFILLPVKYASSSRKRIINGAVAKVYQFPAQVSLQKMSGDHYCGGTLISLDTIMTAAHCFDNLDPKEVGRSKIRILGGALNLKVKGFLASQTRYARSIVIHPKYDKREAANDIGFIKVFRPFEKREHFHPIPRAQKRYPAKTVCMVSGWGSTSSDQNKIRMHSKLLFVRIGIVDNSNCYGPDYHIFNDTTQICAGEMAGGRDTCYGDSGGGLICGGKLAGVVSYGVGCAEKNFPAVYTNVAAYENWTQSVLKWASDSSISKVLVTYKNGCHQWLGLMPHLLYISVATLFLLSNT